MKPLKAAWQKAICNKHHYKKMTEKEDFYLNKRGFIG